jgi:hypothetical protein
VKTQKPLWQCPSCGNLLVTANGWHSCGQFNLEDHFHGKGQPVRDLFDRYLAMVREFGEIRVVPQKTQICFQVRVRFAGAVIRKKWLDAGFWLKRKIESPRFSRVEDLTPSGYVYHVRISTPEDLDDEFREWIKEAYDTGLGRKSVNVNETAF